jgi:outer membrane receptor for ferrienterochelin and colicins
VRAAGIEAEVEGRWRDGLAVRASHAATNVKDEQAGGRMSNAPTHLSKLNLLLPVPRSRATAAFELQHVGERLTLDGTSLDSFLLANATLSTEGARRLELSAGVYNVFNRHYSDPGGEEHVQRSIPQDGRTIRGRVTVRF